MNSHRPFQETYYQQRVLSSLRFAVIAAFLVRGLLHHRLTMQRSQLSAHYANNFAKKIHKKALVERPGHDYLVSDIFRV